MSEFGPGSKRPTQDCEVEIISGLPGPDGTIIPMVIGAGSWDDVGRAGAEADAFAKSLSATGADPAELRTEYFFRATAKAGGVIPQYSFYANSERARQAVPEETPG
ncbi:MAG TPA: hypothetical protein VK712_01245 [Verrucomicrobiae bacterium]|jgi:hypothetical protein|nr:hypothetical protein [Verrucomicrobiae bacterium]